MYKMAILLTAFILFPTISWSMRKSHDSDITYSGDIELADFSERPTIIPEAAFFIIHGGKLCLIHETNCYRYRKHTLCRFFAKIDFEKGIIVYYDKDWKYLQMEKCPFSSSSPSSHKRPSEYAEKRLDPNVKNVATKAVVYWDFEAWNKTGDGNRVSFYDTNNNEILRCPLAEGDPSDPKKLAAVARFINVDNLQPAHSLSAWECVASWLSLDTK